MALDTSPSFQPGDPRLMVRWARRYAKSRTISFLVQWLFIVAMVSAIGVSGTLTHTAYENGQTGLFSVAVALMVLAIVALTWFSASHWGGEIIFKTTQWLYGKEGYAAYGDDDAPETTPLWLTLIGGGLVVHHLVAALLVSFGYLPLLHMQPFSALYMVPFLIIMIVHQDLGFWAWIWPLLYGLHAALLYLDVLNFFPRELTLLHMIVPVFGYGLIAILIGHLYSRFALWKLKSLARSGLDPNAGEDEGAAA